MQGTVDLRTDGSSNLWVQQSRTYDMLRNEVAFWSRLQPIGSRWLFTYQLGAPWWGRGIWIIGNIHLYSCWNDTDVPHLGQRSSENAFFRQVKTIDYDKRKKPMLTLQFATETTAETKVITFITKCSQLKQVLVIKYVCSLNQPICFTLFKHT
jgi:hypothetical protein